MTNFKTIRMSEDDVKRLQSHLEKAVLTYDSDLLKNDALTLMQEVKRQTGVGLSNLDVQ